MDLLHTIILSIVEGVTEFLPISSTGHLVLVSRILEIEQTEFVKSFEIIIQLGAILSIVILYFKELLNTKLWPKIIIAFIPSAIIGGLFYKLIKEFLIGNPLITVIALFVGGLAFIAVEYFMKGQDKGKEMENLTYKNSFIIGLFQSISIIPGVSRAGATILGSLLVGQNRQAAAKFSFILAVPTMFAATSLDIFETKLSFTQNELSMLLVGFIGSFLVALITVKLFVKYLSTNNFIAFGVYRIVAAVIFYVLFLL